MLQAVDELLRSQSTMVLSTCDGAGQAHATPLFYLSGAELELYWFSSRTSLHSRNVEVVPEVSAAIHVPTERWQEIRGVLMRGSVERVTNRLRRKEISREYRERFQLGDLFGVAMARSSLYVLRPRWIRYLDNTRHFGFKFETDLPILQKEQ
jgi:uncharacterized protein YhbP (UPF0306 family)